MKKIILITAILVAAGIWGGFKVVEVTGDYPFCGSCHAWDGEIALRAVADDIHGRANPNGTHATCTDCHLPHSSMLGYLATKAKNGISESITTLFSDPEKKDWIANRAKARAKHTFDSACLKCHSNLLENVNLAVQKGAKVADLAAGAKMHAKYLEFKGTNEAMKCTDCHKYVGHKDLGKMLVEKRHKVANTWDEWEAMQK